jgi:aminoglycoside N3'-acetyltransferase
MDGAPRSRARITEELRDLGLRPGDVVMVHASLRKVGPVEGRADGLIAAVLAAIGPRGTMLMVLGAADDHAWVNERPEAERPALLADAEPFDALRTPAQPDVGTLAEVFRRYPGTVVSDHPEGRFAAHGARARELLDEVPWDDYYGPGSPLEQLAAGGRILRLGADLDTVTALHHAEYRCSVWPKRRARRYRRVATADGPSIRVVECLDDEHGIADYAGEDYFADLLRDYLNDRRIQAGLVGDAPSELLEAEDVVEYGTRWMDEHLDGRHRDVTVEEVRVRLDRDLHDARMRRSGPEVAAIGSLKTALANAEAVPVEARPYELVEGGADVPRRVLGAADIAAIVRAEIEERRTALAQYRSAGAPTADLALELSTLERYRRPAVGR